jgi:cytochrome c peroxidase
MAGEDRRAAPRVVVNLGKAIAAYARTLMPGPSRFDRYVEPVLDGEPAGGGILNSDAEEGCVELIFANKPRSGANLHRG